MPEYSSTTITPADGVQVPSMNGSTSGNFLLSALKSYILAEKGQANGLASLGSDGKLTAAQLPDLADDVIVVASYAVLPAAGTAGKIYITADNNKMFRWDPDLTTPDYVELSVDLSAYATKAELAAEESARESEDSNLKAAIDAIDHRLDNLEQAKGKYEVKNYKDGSVTPSGKGAWAIVEGLRGVSRVENQLCVNGDFSSASGWGSNASATLVYGTNKITVTEATAGSGFAVQNLSQINAVNGHVYLVVATITSNGYCEGYSRLGFDVNDSGVYNGVAFGFASAGTKQVAGLFTSNYSQLRTLGIRFFSTTSAVTVEIKDVILTDLTVYFGGTIPSDADTIAEIQQNYPQLLIPSEYGTRIVDSSYSGVRAWAKNLCNYKNFENTNISTEGQEQPYLICGCSVDYIPVKENSAMVFSANMALNGVRIAEYDADKNFIRRTEGAVSDSFTTTGNTRFVRWIVNYNGSTTVTEALLATLELQLEYGSSRTTFSEYREPSTLSLTFQGKSAGSVSEMYYPETGEQTKPLGEVTVTSSTTINIWGTNVFSVSIGTTKKVPTNSAQKPNILLAGYIPTSYADRNSEAKTITIVPTGFEYPGTCLVRDTSCTTIEQMRSAILNQLIRFELATPDPSTYSDPILDNTLLTEAGGRMATVQTGTVVDGSFDMGFINL